MKLVLASNNAHKVQEIKQILGDGIEILTPQDLGVKEDIPETGKTFLSNALQKAQYLEKFTTYPILADDSGLEVDALGGEPGVYSARYAGPGKNQEENVDLLLKNMEGKRNRGAQFRTVLVLIMDGLEYVFEGIVRGNITTEKRGKKGFGYDPVFVPEGHQRCFAEMEAQEKNAISHRAIAVQKLKDFLEE